MADEKLKVAGIKLKIDGAATFSDNLNKINSRLKTNSAELKKVRAQYQYNEKSIEGLTAKQKALQNSLDTQKKKTTELKDVLAETVEEYGENSKEVERLKSAIADSEAKEASFEAQLRQTNDQLNEQTKSLNNTGKELQQAGEKIEKFGDKTAKVGGKLTTGLTLPIVALGTAAGKMWLDYEKSTAKVETIMDKTVMSSEEMKNKIIENANEIGYSAQEYADTVYEALSAGVKTEDAVGFVKDAAKLAEAGYTSLTKAVDIQTTAMNAYNLSAEDAAHISDVLILTQNKGKTTVDALASSMGSVIPTAKNANVNIDQLGVSYAVLTAKGIKTEKATTYLNSMLNELSKSSSKASKALKKETGSSFSELMEKGYTVADVLQIISDNAKKNKVSLNEMFGSAEASKAALSLVSQEGMTFNDVLKEFNESAGITDSSFETMQTDGVKLTKEIARLKNEAMELGKELTPIVTAATDGLKGITTWFGKLSDEEKKTAVKTLAFVAAAGPVISVSGKIIKTGGKVVKTVGKMAEFFTKSGKAATVMADGTQAASAATGALSASTGVFALAAAIAGASIYIFYRGIKEVSDNVKELDEKLKTVSGTLDADREKVEAAASAFSGLNAELVMSEETAYKIDNGIEKAQEKIIKIAEHAAEKSRGITQKEYEEISKLIGMIDSYTDKKLEAYNTQQAAIKAMASRDYDMTDEKALEYRGSALETYNAALEIAEKTRVSIYNTAQKTYEAAQQAYEKGKISQEQLVEAESEYQKTLNTADANYSEACESIQKQYADTLAIILERYTKANMAGSEASKAINSLIDSEDTYWDKLKKYEGTIWEGLLSAKVSQQNIADSAAEAFTGENGKITAALINMSSTVELYGGEIGEYSQIYTNNILKAFEGLPDEMKETMKESMKGAVKGLEEKEPALYKKSTSIASGVIARLKKAFDIHSPSRVTRRMFQYVDEGAIYGLKDKEQELYSQGEKLGVGTAAAISRGYSSKAVNIGTLADLYPTVSRAGAAYSSSRTYNSTYSNDTYDSGIHIGTLNVNGASGTGALISELETIEYARREQARSRGER